MCASGCERNLLEGYLCEDVRESVHWSSVLSIHILSGVRVSGYGVCWSGVWVQMGRWGLVWCVWVQGYV